MAVFELEISNVVVEGRVIQNGDIGIPSNMFRMAYLAGGLGDFRIQAMITLTSQKISIDLFVAVTAELGLRVLFETRMTTGTLAFILGVPQDHFTRHQQGFNVSSACDVHQQNTHRKKYD